MKQKIALILIALVGLAIGVVAILFFGDIILPTTEEEPVVIVEEEEEVITEGSYHTSENALDWAGVYQGIMPTYEGGNIQVQLMLQYDGFFVLTYQIVDADMDPQIGEFEWDDRAISDNGDFEWNEDGTIIRLDIEGWPPYFQVAEGRLIPLGIDGEPIAEDLATSYEMVKVDLPLN
ncbi:MAG: copper resistance protein NlpE N-terminal domain-containing protein [Pseudomonadales bacterium]|jgi:hypothetical protein|nr:copper resistance protein NlpE N-terminal domain-containing protein [Pseudomonadales bacterium]